MATMAKVLPTNGETWILLMVPNLYLAFQGAVVHLWSEPIYGNSLDLPQYVNIIYNLYTYVHIYIIYIYTHWAHAGVPPNIRGSVKQSRGDLIMCKDRAALIMHMLDYYSQWLRVNDLGSYSAESLLLYVVLAKWMCICLKFLWSQ